jgi:hypothetical protein
LVFIRMGVGFGSVSMEKIDIAVASLSTLFIVD